MAGDVTVQEHELGPLMRTSSKSEGIMPLATPAPRSSGGPASRARDLGTQSGRESLASREHRLRCCVFRPGPFEPPLCRCRARRRPTREPSPRSQKPGPPRIRYAHHREYRRLRRCRAGADRQPEGATPVVVGAAGGRGNGPRSLSRVLELERDQGQGGAATPCPAAVTMPSARLRPLRQVGSQRGSRGNMGPTPRACHPREKNIERSAETGPSKPRASTL